MGKFNVSPGKENALLKRMERLGVFEKDLEETFVRSRGRGGQNVNKNSTCVYLKHIPTEISVKYDKERSQLLNRFFARRELLNRIEEATTGVCSAEQTKIEKIKKQKARRKRKSLNKISTAKSDQ